MEGKLQIEEEEKTYITNEILKDTVEIFQRYGFNMSQIRCSMDEGTNEIYGEFPFVEIIIRGRIHKKKEEL